MASDAMDELRALKKKAQAAAPAALAQTPDTSGGDTASKPASPSTTVQTTAGTGDKTAAAPPPSDPTSQAFARSIWQSLGPLAALYHQASQTQTPEQDVGRSFANWATAGGADPAMAWIGQHEPQGTPSWAQLNPDVQAQRAATTAARGRLGFLDAPVAGAGIYAATRLAPLESAFPILGPAVQMGGYRTGESLVSGERDPTKVLTKTGQGVAEGTGAGLLSKYVAGPLGRLIFGKVYGGDTPESIAEAAQSQAQTAKERLANIPVSAKDLGFTYTQGPVAPGADITYQQLQDELANFAKMHPSEDPSGAGPVLTKKINQALATPETQIAKSVASDTANRATTAQQLADWNRQASISGMDVPGQALDYLKANYSNLTPAQQDAYARIANTAIGGGSPLREMIGAGIGSQLGRAAEAMSGAAGMPLPFLREAGQYFGTKAAALGGEGATQQAILNAYPALYPGASPGALQAGIASDQARQAISNLILGGAGYSGY